MGKRDGGKLYWFCFILWIVVFVLYMVVGKNIEKRRKIWLLNEKGIQFVYGIQDVLLFNVVYMGFQNE